MSQDEFQKHHLPIPCKFCGQGAGYAPLQELSAYGIDVYFCKPCSAEYVFWSRLAKDESYTSCSLYTEINGKMFRLTFQSDGAANLWYIKNPGVPGTRANRDLDMLKAFTHHPDVNPQNINEKIKTWLVFI